MNLSTSPEIMQGLLALIRPVRANVPLRQVLSEDFPRDCSDLPISGGYGYSQDDAIVLERKLFPEGLPINFVSLEYHIAEKLIYEELIIFQDKDNRFSGITHALKQKRTRNADNRWYDCLEFEVSCWSNAHWEQLKHEFESENILNQPIEKQNAHFAKRDATKITYERAFWFDITEVWGISLEPRSNPIFDQLLS